MRINITLFPVYFILVLLSFSGCILPGIYVDQPGVVGIVTGDKLESVGFDQDYESSCNDPDRFVKISEKGGFEVEEIRKFRFIFLPPYHQFHYMYGCFKDLEGQEYLWERHVIHHPGGFVEGYGLIYFCRFENKKLECETEYIKD